MYMSMKRSILQMFIVLKHLLFGSRTNFPWWFWASFEHSVSGLSNSQLKGHVRCGEEGSFIGRGDCDVIHDFFGFWRLLWYHFPHVRSTVLDFLFSGRKKKYVKSVCGFMTCSLRIYGYSTIYYRYMFISEVNELWWPTFEPMSSWWIIVVRLY